MALNKSYNKEKISGEDYKNGSPELGSASFLDPLEHGSNKSILLPTSIRTYGSVNFVKLTVFQICIHVQLGQEEVIIE